MELLTIPQAVEVIKKYFPIGHRRLRKLIHNGELFKAEKYTGCDYIRAFNYGSDLMPRWAIEEEEIKAWIKRKTKEIRLQTKALPSPKK